MPETTQTNTEQTNRFSSLSEVLAGLNIQAVDGITYLDQPALIRYMATATLRGLAGHALCEYSSDMVKCWFKPGQGNNKPPAYVFQPLHSRSMTAEAFPFRIIAFDPPGELLPAFITSLQAAHNRPFGKSGAHVKKIEFHLPGRLEFEPLARPAPALKIMLRTPACLRSKSTWITDKTITVGHIAAASVLRINHLSQHFGNGLQLDKMAFLADAALARDYDRKLEYTRTARNSSTQNTAVLLHGVTGSFIVEGLSANLESLLLAAGAVHIGKHACEGCGCIRTEPILD